jgi:hypothetical protein
MQRPGKKQKGIGAGDGTLMTQMLFFKACKEVLDEYGHDDAAFYFGQVEDHLRDGGSLSAGEAGRILGV